MDRLTREQVGRLRSLLLGNEDGDGNSLDAEINALCNMALASLDAREQPSAALNPLSTAAPETSTAMPQADIRTESSQEDSGPVGIAPYGDTMTCSELADRIKRGEKWQMVAAPTTEREGALPKYPEFKIDLEQTGRTWVLKADYDELREVTINALKRAPADSVTVPREPTKEMEDAGNKADRDFTNNCFHGRGHLSRAAFVYEAMLAARPEGKR